MPGARGFTTRDPAEARHRSMEFLQCPHQMRLGDTSGFTATVSHRSIGSIGLFESRYAAPVTIRCEPYIPYFTINMVAGGRSQIDRERGGTTYVEPGRAAVVDYRAPTEHHVAGPSRMLTVPKAKATAFLAGMLGGAPAEAIVFADEIDLDRDGRRLAGALGTFDRISAHHERTTPSPALAAEIEHAVLSALFLDHRHNHLDRLLAPARTASGSVVDDVVDYIEAALEEPLGAADLAAHAGVSERTLFATFQRELGVSPMAYLRRRRLDRVREVLADPRWRDDPHGRPTVTQIAYRFGFAHMGRFAAAYREAYGESPSRTLRDGL